MRRSTFWQFSALILAATTAAAEVSPTLQDSPHPGTPPADAATLPGALDTPAQAPISPGVEVTGRTAVDKDPVPKLAPDQFTECYSTSSSAGPETMDFIAMEMCEDQLERDRRAVIEKCINRKGQNPPPVVLQACTELLEHKVFIGRERYYVYANRAEAYLALDDRPHALEDYNQAVTLAPHNAKLVFNRAAFYLAQSDREAALRDLNTALSLDPRLVAALLQRAKVRRMQQDSDGALADLTEAIRLEPKTTAAWSERGALYLAQYDYDNAVTDETEAIRLDPKLARAYLYRGSAYGGLGDATKARSDIATAVRLDPSLQRFVSVKGGNPPAAPSR